MVKTLDKNAAYKLGCLLNWLKLRKDYLNRLGSSIDLVPLGAYHCKGKETGVYGTYLLTCYDKDTEEFHMAYIGKASNSFVDCCIGGATPKTTTTG